VSTRYPVKDDERNSRWPERWPLDRIAKRRIELGPLEAARQLDCWAQERDALEWAIAELRRLDPSLAPACDRAAELVAQPDAKPRAG